jgi:hypothetical protein
MSTELKAMKKAIWILMSLIGATGMVSASNNFSYTATGTPGSPPDGVDQNNNPVNVWSVVDTPSNTGGGSGQYFGTAFGGETLSGWQIWSSPFGTGTGNAGSVVATTTFAGGALTIGQTVSINFEMRAIDPGKEVGVDILNGSGAAITFGIFGGEPGPYPYTGNGYYYSDAGSAFVSAGSMGYQYQSEFNIAFTMTGANTYSAVAGSDTWSGTFNGSLTGMDVFNLGAGDGSDVAFNNLTVAPEPSTWAMLAIGGVTLLGRRRIFHQG